MKVTCEDVAELGMEVVAKRKELREKEAHWDYLREDLEEDLGSCRAQNSYLEVALEEARTGLVRTQAAAANLEKRLEAARKEHREDVERRKGEYQKLERHVLRWLKPGDILELCDACVGIAADAACELPAGYKVCVTSEPGLSYQVKCEAEHPAGQLNAPNVTLKEPLLSVRFVSRPDRGAVDGVARRLRDLSGQLTALIDMGAGVHGPALVMRDRALDIRGALEALLRDLGEVCDG